MEQVERVLQWGAAGAIGCSGLLFTLAMGTSHDVRHLSKLPLVRELADIHQLENKDCLAGRQVAATGLVHSKESLSDTLSRRPALASLVKGVETHRRRVRHGWEEGERSLGEARRTVPLSLELKDKQNIELKLSDPRDINPVLEHSVTISHPNQNNMLQALITNSMGYIVTGNAEQEYILPPNTELTAIGELCKGTSLRGDHYYLQPHCGQFAVSRRTIEEQIQHLERWSSGLKTAACILGATGLICVGVSFAFKGYRMYCRRKKRKEEENFLKGQAAKTEGKRAKSGAGPSGSANEKHEWHCIVCWETDVDPTVFPACGHVAVCTNCSTHLTRCPVCRRVSVPRQVFYS